MGYPAMVYRRLGLTPLWGARSAGVSKIMSSNSAVDSTAAPALGGSSDKGITLTSDQAATILGKYCDVYFHFAILAPVLGKLVMV